ncbi:cytochrome P450 [Coniochaeta sp. 2T2.1]|nr:cytochrome P450 [Coniochaeta sp. 2T2.1]
MALLQIPAGVYPRALNAIGLLVLLYLARGVVLLYRRRTRFRALAAKHGYELLPNHSIIFGDLITVGKLMAKCPSDVHGQIVPHLLAQAFPELAKAGLFYVDTWPFTDPMIAVFHPDMMAQFCQEDSRPKHGHVVREFFPFTEGKDLVTSEGMQWKQWRAVFNPGFSTQNIMSLVPSFVEEILLFSKHLGKIAETGETVQMEPQATKAVFDVICRASIGTSLGTQTSADSPLLNALKQNIAWLIPEFGPGQWAKILHPLRTLAIRRNNSVMHQILQPLLEAHCLEHDRTGGPMTAVNLAVRGYMKSQGDTALEKVDPVFLDTAVEHIKMFLFAGIDTTASTVSFAYFFLYSHPDALAEIRREHDSVFGSTVSQAAELISRTPTLLNKLPYTLAVIKEVLRLCPPFGTARAGGPGFFLTNPETRQRFPTDGFLLFSCSHALQRHPAYWPDPDAFKPERWLSDEPESLGRRRNVWRPFELGPRACIGQELAMVELKLILVLTLREFDIKPMYKDGAGKLFGFQAYQAAPPGEVSSHINGGLPVRIEKRL